MTRCIVLPVVVIGLLPLAGCVVVDVDDCCDVVVRQDDVTIAEIDAASDLFSDVHKHDAYIAIAKRPDLTCAAQLRLAKAAFGLFSDTNKVHVLQTLIQNPCMCESTKAQILGDLHRLFSDTDKRRILEAFNRRTQPLVPSV